MNSLMQDLRIAARSLRRAPGFSLAAILTLALGIGASTAVFSAAQSLLLRPLPFHDADRLVDVALSTERGTVFVSASDEMFRALGREVRVVEGVAGQRKQRLNVQAADGPGMASGVLVSDNYFGLLGARPGLGRWPAAADEAAISHPLWLARFGGDRGVLGSTVRINGQPVRVVGVAPAALTATWVGERPELWLPIGAADRLVPEAHLERGGVDLVARLRPGVTRLQAQQALSAAVRANRDPREGSFAADAAVVRGISRMDGFDREAVVGAMRLLAVATGLMLLAACINVTGILLARTMARGRDTALRISLGASRGRVVRGVVAEAMLLSVVGGAAGVLLATWFTRILALLPWPQAVALDPDPGPAVWGFALALSVVSCAAVSLVPVAQLSSARLLPLLKGAAAPGRGARGWAREALVAAQIALSLLLLVGAGLFLRALDRAWRVDPGFEPAGVLTASVDLSPLGYDPARATALVGRLRERVVLLPGVQSAALSMSVPFAGSAGMLEATVPGRVPAPGERPFVGFNSVGAGYFRTLRIPVVRGREFAPGDPQGTALVSEALARRFWPAGDAVGKVLEMGRRSVRVVGVVRDVKVYSLNERGDGVLYLPLAPERSHQAPTLSVRVRPGQEGAVAALLAAEVRRLDRNIPPPTFRSMHDMIGGSLRAQRLGAVLVGGFGVAGLVLSCIGVYGAMAYAVGQRTREIGVRMALGAPAPRVLRMILRQSAVLTGVGLVVGLGAAAAATRIVGHLLFGVSAIDPLTFAAVSLFLGATMLAASYIPARRAARVDPMVALRSE